MYNVFSDGKAYPRSLCSSVTIRVNWVIPLIDKDLRLMFNAGRDLPALLLSG
jgi:hypothetical protein